MYTLWIRNTNDSSFEELCIYNDESTFEEYKIEEANLTMEEGSAGSLNLKVPITNVGYDYFEIYATEIIVRKRTSQSVDQNLGDVYWMGRLLTSSEDFNATLDLTFEGTYNYLMDTVLLQNHRECLPTEWLRYILDKHNEQRAAVEEYWKIVQVSYIDPSIDNGGNTDFYSDYETALDLVNNVFEGWSMHPIFTYSLCSSITYKDYSVSPATNVTVNYDKQYWNLTLRVYKNYHTNGDMTPTINFGENLEDYTKENNVEELATVVIPRGAAYDDEGKARVIASMGTAGQLEPSVPIDGLDLYHTVYSVNNGSVAIATSDSSMLSRFGVVCKVVDFSDCSDYNDLLAMGQNYLANQKWIGTTITIKAVDAVLLGKNCDEIKIGEGVKCYSEPHGLNYTYPCTGIDEDLLDPSATTFTLGIKDDSYMTDASRKVDDDLKNLIIESRIREKLVRANADKDIEDAFNDDTIYSGSQLFQDINETITERMAHAEVVATDDAKANALALLNIYDSDTNPYNKGYVHFKKTPKDYSIPDNCKSLDEIKLMFLNAASAASATSIESFFTEVKNTYMSGNHTVAVVVANNDDSCPIFLTVLQLNPTYATNGVPYLTGYYYNRYYSISGFQGTNVRFVVEKSANVQANGTFTINITSPTVYTINDIVHPTLTSASDVFWPSIASTERTDAKVYLSKDVLTSSSAATKKYTRSLLDGTGNAKDHIYEICISDQEDYTTGNVWRWNKTGLYFIESGTYNQNKEAFIEDPEHNASGYQNATGTLRIGITCDGSIVADRITAGRLDAGIIRAGFLCSQDFDPDHDPQDTASFVLDIERGIMSAKQGIIIFNDDYNNLGAGYGSDRVGNDHFVYISNKTTGETAGYSSTGTQKGYMYISGQRSCDWMMVIGSNFGVDKYGRAFMREGIIGATGGIWDLQFFNETKVGVRWISTGDNSCELKYYFNMNSTAYRPLGAQVSESNIYNAATNMYVCRWRLAKYTDGVITYHTKITNVSPPEGNSALVYGKEYGTGDDAPRSFYPAITYPGTVAQAEEAMGDTYWNGCFFPIFYTIDETTEDPDYTQDGHQYILFMNQGNNPGGKIKIVGGTTEKPEYRCTGGGGYSSVGYADTGAVRIGPGYVYQGNIGTNASFSLSGINRTATLLVPNGSGSSTTTRDDWRLTIGSKFGVTDDGTLHCAGAFLRSATIDSTLSASYINTNNVGGIQLNASQNLDGSNISYTIKIESDWVSSLYYAGPAWLRMYVISGKTYDSNTQETDDIDPVTGSANHQYIPQTNFYDDISFHITISAEFADNNDNSRIITPKLYENDFTFDKDTQTYIDGYVAQEWSMGDAHDWDKYTGYTFHYFDVLVTMNNEKAGNTPTWQMSSWTQDGYADRSGKTHEFHGQMIVTKGIANDPRTVVNFGSRDLVANSRWIGGPNSVWARSYINSMHYHEAISGLSSRIYKNTIQPMPDIFDRLFDDLRPVTFFMNHAERHVKHNGFIMEEVGNALQKNGISPVEFGAYAPHIEGAGGELCYLDFIALNTRQIQKLKQRVKELEERLDEVERNENSSNT